MLEQFGGRSPRGPWERALLGTAARGRRRWGGGEGGKERDVVCRVTSLKGVRGEWGALRNPRKLGRLVAGISEGSPLPLTVKIRTGVSSGSINLPQVRPSPHPLATCPLGCLLCCDIAEFLR